MRKTALRWRIIQIRGNKAVEVGTVAAKDEAAAIRNAIREYQIKDPERIKRLAARPE